MEMNRRNLRELVLLAGLLLLGYWALQNLDQITTWFSWAIRLLMPFIVGGALAFIFYVPMHSIETRLPKKICKGRRALAFILTLLSLFAVLSVMTGLVVPQLLETVLKLTSALPGFGAQILSFLQDVGTQFPFLQPMISEWATLNWQTIAENVLGFITSYGGSLMDNTVTAASGIFGGIVNGIVSFIFCIYILFGQETLVRQCKMLLYAFCPKPVAERTFVIAARSKRIFSSFLTGQCLEAVILGLIFAVVMAIFKMPYIPLICVLISFTALIPMVGAFIGCAVGALLIAVDNPILALWFCVLFVVIQQLEGNLVYPRVVGNSIGLPSMWVLVAVSIGGGVGGVAGMLVMIPLTSVLYSILCETVYKRLTARNLVDEFLPKAEDAVDGTETIDVVDATDAAQTTKATKTADTVEDTNAAQTNEPKEP